MKHIFKQGKHDAPTLILLHGTGGDEHDLLPLGEALNPDYNLLGIRGQISENGMNRYFKRLGDGIYDLEDLEYRGQELLNFIKEAAETYGFDLEKVVLVGFSNGSNIAINLMLRQDAPFKKALLYAPLYPLDVADNKDMSDVSVLLSMGENDPMVTLEGSQHVIDLFQSRGANVTEVWVNSHEITQQGLIAGQQVLDN
ncbi:methylhydroquinone degradation carboxylesterase MhqD [Staphylococcus simiae]|uniref:Putative phospholipase/carboxylesterase n=1 Tax=Staphylococcus simiae CCM 7213 = CCUG 51256 TaxID=911238 RepID=G5JI11_9STAP|nr:alpha/beta hydrolase [Staphylococcus simiae]EHJ08204.1 putative phospholipase/carboxylesterase [Staphylococcus simiae CCM 7213 = CCUG 51256]PNZ14266.1 carboxylesterase [Staphylococcus simiae]SNV81941.1 phospholipase/Carboxylesterase [Staphylococcus simiae]